VKKKKREYVSSLFFDGTEGRNERAKRTAETDQVEDNRGNSDRANDTSDGLASLSLDGLTGTVRAEGDVVGCAE
jgi:hypothetical protein